MELSRSSLSVIVEAMLLGVVFMVPLLGPMEVVSFQVVVEVTSSEEFVQGLGVVDMEQMYLVLQLSATPLPGDFTLRESLSAILSNELEETIT